MNQINIIRMGLIAVALFLGYSGIVCLINFIDYLLELAFSSDKPGALGFLNLLLRTFCFFAASYLLIKNSRKIAAFIDEQK